MTNLDDIIISALNEDIGDGDHTTRSTVPSDARGKARLIVKQEGILSGVLVAKRVFEIVDDNLEIEIFLQDGAEVKNHDVAFIVSGFSRSILTSERLVLNFMQRMSGIATVTRKYVDAVKGYKAQILDTRKTTPNFRLIEKQAVKTGGALNHRFGLYDMILIKDNHIDYAGGIEEAIHDTRSYLKALQKPLKIEIEARSLEDVGVILRLGGVDRIMLDNFSPANMQKAVEIIAGKYETEASGGITLENVRDYAATGVDFISIGALTHQIYSLDMSLKAII
jgi:nicotinate-nucleotide pyrophosphorylase (carboxylating)